MPVKGDFYCKSHEKRLKEKQAREHHKAGCEVWYMDPESGELTRRYGEKQGSKVVSPPPRRPIISAEGDEHIKEHVKGYSKDGENYLFVLHPDGTVRDFRLEQPLLYPIFELMKRERSYKGDFPEFIADAVETLFANAGYELTLAPKSHNMIYQEVLKLIEKGDLELVHEGDAVRLGVKDGYKDERAQGRDSSPGEEPGVELPQQEREEEPGEPQ